jgi:uncharacterized protein (TIGR02646 family)
MRHIDRFPEPEILVRKKTEWTNNFLASDKRRPDSSKYAHPNIKAYLNSMSYHKCFYCETKLKGIPSEVDHCIEVKVDKNQAFEWGNLYLCCDNCNNKIPHDTISIHAALNPCSDSDDKIREHLTFNDELIVALSPLGLQTIQKYRLDTELLDHRRLKQIHNFQKVYLAVKDKQIAEHRDYLTDDERNALHRFKQADYSYSLMFSVLLDKYGL